MSDFKTFIKDHRDLIRDIVDVLFISTHYYLQYNEYNLVKDNNTIDLQKSDINQVKKAFSIRQSENQIKIHFENYQTKNVMDAVVSLDNQNCQVDDEYLKEKLLELFKWLNFKSKILKKAFSIEQLKNELVDFEFSIAESSFENILSPINIIVPTDQDKMGDGYIAHKSIIQQKQRPRTNELKMSLTIEEFFESYLNRNEYLNNENIRQISMYKLIYYYFTESKRLLGVDLFLTYPGCTPNHKGCPIRKYPNHECDLNSLTGRCVRLYSTRVCNLNGIKGKFKSILPGIYEIICRIKLDKNNEYLTYYNECCSKYDDVEKGVGCYFYALADHGLDCECDRKKLNFDWFESNYLLHGNTNWFNETMGKIKVFELSDIYFGFRLVLGYGYRNILFDYIQLNIIE